MLLYWVPPKSVAHQVSCFKPGTGGFHGLPRRRAQFRDLAILGTPRASHLDYAQYFKFS
jgi:hypothetical protein